MSNQKQKTVLDVPFHVEEKWSKLLDNADFVKMFFLITLEDYIVKQRWCSGKANRIKYIELTEYFKIENEEKTYISAILEANLNIGYNQKRDFILKYCLLKKVVYKLGYKLNSHPSWGLIPLKGIPNLINK